MLLTVKLRPHAGFDETAYSVEAFQSWPFPDPRVSEHKYRRLEILAYSEVRAQFQRPNVNLSNIAIIVNQVTVMMRELFPAR